MSFSPFYVSNIRFVLFDWALVKNYYEDCLDDRKKMTEAGVSEGPNFTICPKHLLSSMLKNLYHLSLITLSSKNLNVYNYLEFS